VRSDLVPEALALHGDRSAIVPKAFASQRDPSALVPEVLALPTRPSDFRSDAPGSPSDASTSASTSLLRLAKAHGTVTIAAGTTAPPAAVTKSAFMTLAGMPSAAPRVRAAATWVSSAVMSPDVLDAPVAETIPDAS
jgi:hypothetical protein